MDQSNTFEKIPTIFKNCRPPDPRIESFSWKPTSLKDSNLMNELSKYCKVLRWNGRPFFGQFGNPGPKMSPCSPKRFQRLKIIQGIRLFRSLSGLSTQACIQTEPYRALTPHSPDNLVSSSRHKPTIEALYATWFGFIHACV